MAPPCSAANRSGLIAAGCRRDSYRAEEVRKSPRDAKSPIRAALPTATFLDAAATSSSFPSPTGSWTARPRGKARSYGTGHGTPYNYDQHVPVLLMGYGIQPGKYSRPVTPADIAPTLAALCGITLASRDGHVLAEALQTELYVLRPRQSD